ncbi:hypothetical protein [Pantoea stewartii]|uniref:hypothetical protein n=1 Tax=Pantoea stewartii TaxID=66269 RepID=UPI003B987D2E
MIMVAAGAVVSMVGVAAGSLAELFQAWALVVLATVRLTWRVLKRLLGILALSERSRETASHTEPTVTVTSSLTYHQQAGQREPPHFKPQSMVQH